MTRTESGQVIEPNGQALLQFMDECQGSSQPLEERTETKQDLFEFAWEAIQKGNAQKGVTCFEQLIIAIGFVIARLMFLHLVSVSSIVDFMHGCTHIFTLPSVGMI